MRSEKSVAGLLLVLTLFTSCKQEEDTVVYEKSRRWVEKTVAVVAPMSADSAMKARFERTTQWFLDNFHQACEAVRKGLPNAYNWGGEVDSGKHYNLEFGNYALEVHRISADVIDPKENAAYAAIELEGLKQHAQKVDFEGFPLTIPSKEFMVFFTFYHAWHHFLTTGVGWKQIADVAITLHAYRGQLDHDTLRRYFTDMHVLKPWQAFGYLMVHYLGLPEEEMPFYNPSVASTAQRLYARIMEEGNFKRDRSFKRRRPKRRLGQKMHAFVGIFVDFFHLAKVFPASAWREMRNSLGHAFAKNLPHGEKNGH